MSLSIVGSNSTRNLSPICTDGSVASRSDSSADGSSNSGLLVSYMSHFTIVSRLSQQKLSGSLLIGPQKNL